MEHLSPETSTTTERKTNDLARVFGETGANKLKAQIAYDIPALSDEEVTTMHGR